MMWANVPPPWLGIPMLIVVQLVLIGILFFIGRDAFTQIKQRDLKIAAANGALLVFLGIMFGILCWLWTPYF